MTMRVILLVAATSLAGAGESSGPERGWRAVHDRLSAGCAAMARDLEAAHAALVERAGDDEEAVARLSPEPVALRPPGYGVLPEIVGDAPRDEVKPEQKRYSLEQLQRES